MRGVEHMPRLYDLLASVLDAAGLKRWRLALVADLTGRVLEIGCGTGRNFPHYRAGARVIGLEPDRAVLVRARRRSRGIALVQARAEALPFRTASFDAVVSSLVFCIVEDPPGALRELHRVLASEGELKMLEHVRAARPAWRRLQDRLQPLWTRVTGGCRLNRETEAAVEEADFRIVAESRRSKFVLRLFRACPKRKGSGDSA